MNDDLSKAEQEWANRSLFRQPRRRGRWWWLFALACIAVAAVLLHYRERLFSFL